MFDYVIDPFIKHLSSLLNDYSEILRKNKLKYICLVGGFSKSEYLKWRIKKRFGSDSIYKLIMVVPKNPILSVVDGAARMIKEKDFIQKRVIAHTYGVNGALSIGKAKAHPNISNEHIEKYRYFNEIENAEYVAECFVPFVMKGEIVSFDEPIEKMSHYSSMEVTQDITQIYATDAEEDTDMPGVVTDMTPLATLTINLPRNYDPTKPVRCYFYFGDAMMKVVVSVPGIDDDSLKQVALAYNIDYIGSYELKDDGDDKPETKEQIGSDHFNFKNVHTYSKTNDHNSGDDDDNNNEDAKSLSSHSSPRSSSRSDDNESDHSKSDSDSPPPPPPPARKRRQMTIATTVFSRKEICNTKKNKKIKSNRRSKLNVNGNSRKSLKLTSSFKRSISSNSNAHKLKKKKSNSKSKSLKKKKKKAKSNKKSSNRLSIKQSRTHNHDTNLDDKLLDLSENDDLRSQSDSDQS